MATTSRDLRSLPKAHLHLHLDGAMRLSTLVELCSDAGVPAPAIPDEDAYGSFEAFMETIRSTHTVLRRTAALERVVREIVEDNAADGAVWVEVSVWPGVFGGSEVARRSIETILATGQDAARRSGVEFGLMIAANRHAGTQAAVDAARLAVDYGGSGVVSFGLDGDERVGDPSDFVAAFAIAGEAGLTRAPHAGETRGPASIASAITLLGADRVLHGVRAVEDTAVCQQLLDSGISLDVCITSNVKLSVVPTASDHPLPALLAAGIACSLNADDPLLFGTSLLMEYHLARSALALDDDRLADIATTSITTSNASESLKARSLEGITAWRRTTPT